MLYVQKEKGVLSDTPFFLLDQSLSQHGIRYFHEATNIRPFYIINVIAITAIFLAGLVNIVHDEVKTFVDFFPGPIVSHAVL
jgi:hypothetical protein